MIDPWDSMIEGDDEEVAAEIRADLTAYTLHLGAGNHSACANIEKKYGLYGLTPEMVSFQLAEMGKPAEGGAS